MRRSIEGDTVAGKTIWREVSACVLSMTGVGKVFLMCIRAIRFVSADESIDERMVADPNFVCVSFSLVGKQQSQLTSFLSVHGKGRLRNLDLLPSAIRAGRFVQRKLERPTRVGNVE